MKPNFSSMVEMVKNGKACPTDSTNIFSGKILSYYGLTKKEIKMAEEVGIEVLPMSGYEDRGYHRSSEKKLGCRVELKN